MINVSVSTLRFVSDLTVQLRCRQNVHWLQSVGRAAVVKVPHGWLFDVTHPAWLNGKARQALLRQMAAKRQAKARATDQTLAQRLGICQGCEHQRGMMDKTLAGVRVVRVTCARCTTCEGGRSLTAAAQTCPAGKWQGEAQQLGAGSNGI